MYYIPTYMHLIIILIDENPLKHLEKKIINLKGGMNDELRYSFSFNPYYKTPIKIIFVVNIRYQPSN